MKNLVLLLHFQKIIRRGKALERVFSNSSHIKQSCVFLGCVVIPFPKINCLRRGPEDSIDNTAKGRNKGQLFFGIGITLLLSACSSMPLKEIKYDKPKALQLSVISGNQNIEKYKTVSKVKVYKTEGSSNKLIENKFESSEFDLHRLVQDVNEQGVAQLRYWVANLHGDVDLVSMGLPPQGKILIKAIDKSGEVLAVQNFPAETVFYLPKIILPEKKVKKGDSWDYSRKWRSLKTGFPFQVDLVLTLDNWLECGSLMCAHIKYTGNMSLPKESPFDDKSTKLESHIEGEIIYAPVGHQFIWSKSVGKEVFYTVDKKVLVDSCTVSFQTLPDKESFIFAEKFGKSCK